MAEPISGATPLEGYGKRILMVIGSPKTISLCHALGDAYAQGARSQGHVVRVLKLEDLEFKPTLHNGYESSQTLEHDLLEAQREIHWAQHLVFVYPVWWGGLPSLLSGFFERVFMPGFAFKAHGRHHPSNELLKGRTAEMLVTLDTPSRYFRWVFKAPAHRQIRHAILEFCGIKVTRLTEFSPVRTSTEEQRQQWIHQAEGLGKR